jgi:hypothetical protein
MTITPKEAKEKGAPTSVVLKQWITKIDKILIEEFGTNQQSHADLWFNDMPTAIANSLVREYRHKGWTVEGIPYSDRDGSGWRLVFQA